MIRMSVEMGESIRHDAPSVVPGLARRRAQAAVREGSTIIRDRARLIARPHRRTGIYEAGLTVQTPRTMGNDVIGGVIAMAPHSEALETGRGPVTAAFGKALKLVGIKTPLVSGQRATGFAAHVGPARALHILARARAATEDDVMDSAEKWAHAIANDIRGRIQ